MESSSETLFRESVFPLVQSTPIQILCQRHGIYHCNCKRDFDNHTTHIHYILLIIKLFIISSRMMPPQDNPTSPVASGSMTQTLTISVDRGLIHGAFQTYRSESMPVPHLDMHRQLELSGELVKPDDSFVPAKLLLAWAMVAKSFAGTDSVVILGPKAASIVLDGSSLVVDQIKAIGSHLDGSAASNSAITPVVDQPHLHPLALRYAYSEGDGIAPTPTNAPLSITFSSRQGRWSADLSANSRVIDQGLLPLLSSTFQRAFHHLRSASPQLIQRDISLSDSKDLGMLQMLAGRPPPPVSSLVHDMIGQRARKQPDAEASVSWDVSLTYAELDGLSDIVASHLVSIGLQVGSTVVTCLEKSGWVPAIYLAVLKAGGAFAPVSPGLSEDQLTSAMARLSPSIVISSTPNLRKFVGLAEHVLDISDILKTPNNTKTQLLSNISVAVHNPACVLFTSNGVEEETLLVLDHVAVCTSIITNSNIHDFSPATRTLQFAPYDSRTSIADVLFTLAAGGCVCTASEHEQIGSIADACTRMKPSLACLTPSLAAVLNQDDLPGVDTIILAGENLDKDSVEKWAAATNLINAYAPTAALGYACCTAPLITISSPRNIGWPRGCAIWVMDPQDPTRLAPPGAVGQLLVESPFIGQSHESGNGDLASTLVPRPECLSCPNLSPEPAGSGRCFLTEHLVHFDIGDGTLQLVGHKSSKGQLSQFDSHASSSVASSVGETPTVTGPISTPMAASVSQTSLDTTTIDVNLQTTDTRFALLSLSPEKLSRLEALLHPLGQVQECYPCCPVQEGILVSQVKAPGTYNILVIWELANAATVSLARLRTAWERVVKRHAPLRSTFIESLRDGSVFDQVVLTSPSVDVVELPWLEDLTEEDDMLQLTALTWDKGRPHHRLGLSKAADGRLRCQLLISHAVIDGLSVQALGHDLERSLDGVLPDSPPTDLQRRYFQQLQQVPSEGGREFWRTYLDGLFGCLLPKLTDWTDQGPARVYTKRRELPNVKQLRRFCQEQGTTLFSLTQAAWALVLRAYTLSDDVCFAFMATDRHLLGDNADRAVGFFINLMLCRVGLDGSTPIADVLSALRRDFVSGFPYQHHPLAEIAHEQGVPASQLFNTTITFMSDDENVEPHCDGVQLHRVVDQDVAEVWPFHCYPITR